MVYVEMTEILCGKEGFVFAGVMVGVLELLTVDALELEPPF